jgi:hypothetical protein
MEHLPTYDQLDRSPLYDVRRLKAQPGLYVIQPYCRTDFKTIKFGKAKNIRDMMKSRYAKAYSRHFRIHAIIYDHYDRIDQIEADIKRKVKRYIRNDNILSESGEYFKLSRDTWRRFTGYLKTSVQQVQSRPMLTTVQKIDMPSWITRGISDHTPRPERMSRTSRRAGTHLA